MKDTCLNSGEAARGSCRKSARRAAMQSAPVATAVDLSRCNRLGSLSKASTRPLPCISAAAQGDRLMRCTRQCDTADPVSRLVRTFSHVQSFPGHVSLTVWVMSLSPLPARWVVLLPGAAQASSTSQPGWGANACAGMHDALLCNPLQGTSDLLHLTTMTFSD